MHKLEYKSGSPIAPNKKDFQEVQDIQKTVQPLIVESGWFADLDLKEKKEPLLVVIEGPDGSGKSTQVEMLLNYFKDIPHTYLHFPRYQDPYYGYLITRFLRGDYGTDVDPYLVASLYAGDRLNANQFICDELDNGKVVILDRYVYSNIAYQAAKVADPSERLKLIKWIYDLEFHVNKIRAPDINICLDIPFTVLEAELQKERKGSDRDYLNNSSDIHETDLELQKEVVNMYSYLCSVKSPLPCSVRVDCMEGERRLSPEELHLKILEVLEITIELEGYRVGYV
jgi:dTMP kinase